MLKRVFVLLLVLALIFGAASCGQTVKTPAKKTVIKKTVAKAFPGQTGKRPANVRSVDYTDPSICSGCHIDIFTQWSKSMHNLAYNDPIYQKVLTLAKQEGAGEFDEFCTACHTPIGFSAGETPPWVDANLSEVAKKGVQCDFCHTVKSATGIGNYQFLSSPGNVKRGPFKDAISPYHETKYSELHTTAEFCGMCHNANHLKNGLPLEATYSEWKAGPYAEKGIICQDCHMTPGPGVTKPNPGVAAVGAKKRPHIWTHDFVGGNAVVTALEGNVSHQQMAMERLQAAAGLLIKTTPLKLNGQNKIKIEITNKGCGHYLPTGLTETREMWLDVTIMDAAGKQIFSTGALDETGNIPEGSIVFKTIVADKSGHHTDSIWFAEKIVSDKRIPPKKTVIEPLDFNVPADAVTPLTVNAVLKYRSASQRTIDLLFGPGQMTVPVIEMVQAKAQIK